MKRLFLALAFTGVAWCQFQGTQFQPLDGIVPNNGCPNGSNYFPWEYPYMRYHAYLRDAAHTPIPFAPYILYAPTTVLQSGVHSHETTLTKRPGPVILDSTTGITDAQGNSPTFEVQLDGFSGWNTFSASLVGGFAYTCINNFLRYVIKDRVSQIGRPLVPYPEDIFTNMPQALHYDDRHQGPLGPVYSRYLGEGYVTSLHNASLSYRGTSIAAGALDRIDIFRCSLPYGGISDNDSAAYAPGLAFGGNWAARPQEQHLDGRACDVRTPSYNLPSSPLTGLMLTALHENGCEPGAFTPDGSYLPDAQRPVYWGTQDKMHVVCAPAGTTTAPPVHR